jgi:hypothetical protein
MLRISPEFYGWTDYTGPLRHALRAELQTRPPLTEPPALPHVPVAAVPSSLSSTTTSTASAHTLAAPTSPPTMSPRTLGLGSPARWRAGWGVDSRGPLRHHPVCGRTCSSSPAPDFQAPCGWRDSTSLFNFQFFRSSLCAVVCDRRVCNIEDLRHNLTNDSVHKFLDWLKLWRLIQGAVGAHIILGPGVADCWTPLSGLEPHPFGLFLC